MNRQFSASCIMLSLVIKRQPEMFRPCNLLQCSAMVWIETSVMCSSPEISRASNEELFSTNLVKP